MVNLATATFNTGRKRKLDPPGIEDDAGEEEDAAENVRPSHNARHLDRKSERRFSEIGAVQGHSVQS